jgi:3-hydroxyacyl-CoA dehydrogenase
MTIRPCTRLEAAYDANIVFEAVIENPDLKVNLLKQINENNRKKPWFFTNTSSIPISQLDEKAGLEGRIIGFHFYNPPAVQKLVELIKGKNTLPEMEEFALEYAKKLKKIVVPSNDFAGFIGNGHFMRDALHGITEAERIAKELNIPLYEAVYIVNKISQEFLVRPMGIFQLIDYVGIDVVRYIMSVMNPYLPNEDLHSDLLDKLYDMGVKGGQYSDGSQKDGFLKYEKGKIVAVYDIDSQQYIPIEKFEADANEKIGKIPENLIPWKSAIRSKNKDEQLKKLFDEISQMDTLGADLAKRYMRRSREIARQLVSDGVAFNDNDVNTVLMTGFFHAYGPINDFLL